MLTQARRQGGAWGGLSPPYDILEARPAMIRKRDCQELGYTKLPKH